VLIDETGLFLNPTVRRSWSLIGRTPVIGGDGEHPLESARLTNVVL
jgi:hypothetical protein